jgi:hypothetical protein
VTMSNLRRKGNGLKLSFRDLYWNKVPKAEAQVVHLQFFQRGKLEWKGYAPIYRPAIYRERELLANVALKCHHKNCPWYTSYANVNVYRDKNRRLILTPPHIDVMCEHMWAAFKSNVDQTLTKAERTSIT